MNEHPVRRKLQQELLPYLLSAQLLKRQWYYMLHVLFGYTTDLVVALTAIGISSPLLGLFVPPEPSEGREQSLTLPQALEVVPKRVALAFALLVLIWLVLRVAYTREDGAKRAVLAKSCSQSLRECHAALHRILLKTDPMEDLVKLADERISPTVDRNIQEGSWPWLGPAPEVGPAIEKELAHLCNRYQANWQQVAEPQLRAVS